MIDRGAMVDDPGSLPGEPHNTNGPHHSGETLEQRVHRLEDAVAALQDTQIMEDRVCERVMGKMGRILPPDAAGIIEAERRGYPPAGDAPPAEEPPPGSPPLPPAVTRSAWLVVEVFRELRTIIRMFFDPRFRVSWSAVFALMILAAILVSQWLPQPWMIIPVIGPVLDKVVGLILALFAYKILSREMRRYQEAVAHLPSYRRY